MNILFVVKSMARPGGAERVLATVMTGLVQRGHDITLMSYDAPDAEHFYPVDTLIKWVKLGAGRADAKTSACETLSRIRLLRRTIRKLRPDVAVGFMHSVFVPLALALVGTRIPVVASEHIGFHHYEPLAFQRRLLKATRPFIRATTMISEAIRASFPRTLRSRTVVIPNPVQPFRSDPGAAPSDGRKLLLSVGRLEAQKDHRTLVAAFAAIAARFPDWDVEIFGEGELRPALEAQIAQLGMTQRVKLPGITADIGAEYRRADIFVMPSLYESFGLATAEALSCEVPAIGFADCPGTNEVIDDGENGLLVSGPDRVVALADGMARLIEAPDLCRRLGEAGPQSVARFKAEAVATSWEDMLDRVKRGAAVEP